TFRSLGIWATTLRLRPLCVAITALTVRPLRVGAATGLFGLWRVWAAAGAVGLLGIRARTLTVRLLSLGGWAVLGLGFLSGQRRRGGGESQHNQGEEGSSFHGERVGFGG
ncbi:MAG: hypothetical protein U0984_15505, partial [Prosthecobacter sp.]|nr:hypothetical protein [Prosthecobacter sp.]